MSVGMHAERDAPGLMEQLSMPIMPKCMSVTESPMARGASVGMWNTSSPRSVSMAQKTVNTRTKVPDSGRIECGRLSAWFVVESIDRSIGGDTDDSTYAPMTSARKAPPMVASGVT